MRLKGDKGIATVCVTAAVLERAAMTQAWIIRKNPLLAVILLRDLLHEQKQTT